MKKDAVLEILTSKEYELQNVLFTSVPVAPWLYPMHQRRMENARVFLEELKEVKQLLQKFDNASIVPLHVFRQHICASKNHELEFSGHFCNFSVVTDASNVTKNLLTVTDVDLL